MTTRMKTSRIFVAAFALVLLSSCAETAETYEVGNVRFPLEAATNAGNIFRLQNAVFEIARANETITIDETDGPEPFVMVALPSGAYTVELKDGWSMVRVEDDETVPVNAVLLTANPVSFEVVAQAMVDVVFVFDVNGNELPLGAGKVNIGFSIREATCGNGFRNQEEECDPLIDGFEECDFRCTGVKSCNSDFDCASAVCEETCPGCPIDETCVDECTEQRLAEDRSLLARASSEPNTNAGQVQPAASRSSVPDLLDRATAAACPATCEDNRNQCTTECNVAQGACITGCGALGPFALACLPACDEIANGCRNGCNNRFDDCAGGCPPNPYEPACTNQCTPKQCQSCEIAGRCPLLGRFGQAPTARGQRAQNTAPLTTE